MYLDSIKKRFTRQISHDAVISLRVLESGDIKVLWRWLPTFEMHEICDILVTHILGVEVKSHCDASLLENKIRSRHILI